MQQVNHWTHTSPPAMVLFSLDRVWALEREWELRYVPC